jgi:lipopolysaccharide/colanic/teichoic acid biosynthesis glycosyltransferase
MHETGKRIFDVLVASLGLVAMLPLLIPTAVLLLLTGEHEVFYLQARIGYKNRKFQIWKFATMLKISPSIGTGSLTLRNDPRVLRVGKYLRATKINELPQIVNVLLGDMSIVGPRPQMEVDFKAYPEHVQRLIYDVKPGLTGIGSIVFRDEERILSASSLPPKECYRQFIAPYKGELELWYQQNAGFILDLKLIALTALVILRPGLDVHRYLKGLPERPSYLRQTNGVTADRGGNS